MVSEPYLMTTANPTITTPDSGSDIPPPPPPTFTSPAFPCHPPPPYFHPSILAPPPNYESIVPITTPVPVKLTHSNYLTWKAQVLPLINGYNYIKYITSPSPNPTRHTADGQIEFNPEYLPWNRHDQLLLGWLRASITEPIQAQLISCTTSASLWSTLQQQFSSCSRAKLIDLKRQLQTSTKASSSCIDFLNQIHHIADELAFIGAPPSDDDLVLAVLNGLGSDYNAFVAAVTATNRRDALTFADLHGMLLSHEALLKGQMTASSSLPSAFFVGS